ncbi:MAG: ABC transporter permease [Actinomycetota bacterium]|nr:ABC transporter permease [Actinomycetota bacterium]
MRSLRVFFIGGIIAYKALFNWLKPSIYIPTMLGGPLFQILFFTYLGRFSGVQNDGFFVVGNAVQACAMSAIYGMTMTIANERYFGTLAPLLASPANRLALFLGRALPVVVNGLVVSIFGFCVGLGLLHFHLALGQVPALAAVLVVTVTSCTGLGLLLGSIGLRARDVFFISNSVYWLMLLLCGVNVPLSILPGWVQTIGRALPLTHGIAAARTIAGGGSFAQVAGGVAAEFRIGVLYGLAAYGLFRLFEVEARRRASLERV